LQLLLIADFSLRRLFSRTDLFCFQRLTKTNFEGRRTRTNSPLCCLLYITLGRPDRKPRLPTVGCYATNTGHPTVGCHATQQYRSGERIHVFDYGCLVTTDSSQTRHNIIIQQDMQMTLQFPQTVSEVLQTDLGIVQQWCHRTNMPINTKNMVIILSRDRALIDGVRIGKSLLNS
jgi:hypothetical protein